MINKKYLGLIIILVISLIVIVFRLFFVSIQKPDAITSEEKLTSTNKVITYENSIFNKNQYLDINFASDQDSKTGLLPFGVEPRLISIIANPGERKTINLLITKKDSFRIDDFIWVSKETLAARDYLDETIYDVVAKDTNPYSLRSWIIFPKGLVRSDGPYYFSRIDFDRISDSYDRPTKESVVFPIEIDIPKDTPNGDYFGVLNVEIPSGPVPSVSILTTVQVGEPRYELQINSLDILSNELVTTIALRLSNLSNAIVELDGYFDIDGEKFPIKQLSPYQPIRKSKFILPKEKEHISRFSFYKKLLPGKKYNLNVKLQYGDGKEIDLSKEFTPRKFIGT